MNKEMTYRMEKDFLGEKKIPREVYWGIHTERARENFPISGYRMNPSLIKALAVVKKACAEANLELGYLEEKKAKAIFQACDDISEGNFSDQFPVDALQGGAGTSSNMNINEVLGNRAAELLGGERGTGIVHPVEDVNLHQSTNDRANTLLQEYFSSGRNDLREFLSEKLGKNLVEKILSPYQLTSLGYR